MWKAVIMLLAKAAIAFPIPNAIFATPKPKFLKNAITTLMPPVITPKPVLAIPVIFAIALHTAKITATNAIISKITQVSGQDSNAVFKPYCAAVAAAVALASAPVAAACA